MISKGCLKKTGQIPPQLVWCLLDAVWVVRISHVRWYLPCGTSGAVSKRVRQAFEVQCPECHCTVTM